MIKTSQWGSQKQPTPATASPCNEAIRTPGPPTRPLGSNACSVPKGLFLRIPRQGQRIDKERPLVWCCRNVPPTALSAPCRPPIGHRDSVHGKPRKAANQSIPRPAPLAPWRGPRGWGLGGAQPPSPLEEGLGKGVASKNDGINNKNSSAAVFSRVLLTGKVKKRTNGKLSVALLCSQN